MLFLWVFGDNVEDALGHFRFLSSTCSARSPARCLHGLVAPESQVPLIGASGAIAGVVAAYLILHPRVKIWILAFGRIPLRIPAYIALVLWIVFQFVMFAVGGEDQISWACHVGGIIAGAVLWSSCAAATCRCSTARSSRRAPSWSSSRARCGRSRPSRRRAGAGNNFEPI